MKRHWLLTKYLGICGYWAEFYTFKKENVTCQHCRRLLRLKRKKVRKDEKV